MQCASAIVSPPSVITQKKKQAQRWWLFSRASQMLSTTRSNGSTVETSGTKVTDRVTAPAGTQDPMQLIGPNSETQACKQAMQQRRLN